VASRNRGYGLIPRNPTRVSGSDQKDSWEQAATNHLLHNCIKIRSLNFIRERGFQNKFIVIDEVLNLTSQQMETLIQAGTPQSKASCRIPLAAFDGGTSRMAG